MITTLLAGLKLTHVAAASAVVLGGASVAAAAPGVPSLAELFSEDIEEEVEEELDLDLDDDLDAEEGLDADLDLDLDADEDLDEDLDVDEDLDEELSSDEDDDGEPSAFAAWVQSVPSDWGCVRGRLIAANAAGDKTDFTAPEGVDTLEDAIATLGLEGARCAEVALQRAGGGEVDDDEASDEVTTSEAPDARRGPPANAGGPPAHAGGPRSGDEARGAGGPPAGRGGPPAGRGPNR